MLVTVALAKDGADRLGAARKGGGIGVRSPHDAARVRMSGVSDQMTCSHQERMRDSGLLLKRHRFLSPRQSCGITGLVDSRKLNPSKEAASDKNAVFNLIEISLDHLDAGGRRDQVNRTLKVQPVRRLFHPFFGSVLAPEDIGGFHQNLCEFPDLATLFPG